MFLGKGIVKSTYSRHQSSIHAAGVLLQHKLSHRKTGLHTDNPHYFHSYMCQTCSSKNAEKNKISALVTWSILKKWMLFFWSYVLILLQICLLIKNTDIALSLSSLCLNFLTGENEGNGNSVDICNYYLKIVVLKSVIYLTASCSFEPYLWICYTIAYKALFTVYSLDMSFPQSPYLDDS